MEYIGRIEGDKELNYAEQIIIYGCGKTGNSAWNYIYASGKGNCVKGFCDQSIELQGNRINGILVYSVEEAAKKYVSAVFLVCGVAVREMVNRLKDLGITRIHIIHF